MKTAYTLLGLLFLLLIAGALFFVGKEANAPTTDGLSALTSTTMTGLTLTSSAFKHNGTIPSRYTCDGLNTSPPLSIGGVPEGTASLVLLVDDPDIPQVFKAERGIDSFDHWTLYNIPPAVTSITEGESVGEAGLNGRGNAEYTGPCPPTEYEPTEHRYIFKLYALSEELYFDAPPTKTEVQQAMEGKILGTTELVGLYDRKQQ